ncbi:MAG: ABC transporter permease [Bacteroidales bacterium]
MRTILFLIRKEFLQIFRNRFIGRAIFAIPLIQMLILVPAVTFEIKYVNLCIIDNDRSVESRELIGKLEGSPFFRVKYYTWSEEKANELIYNNKCSAIINIPSGFGKELGAGRPVKILARIDAINAMKGQLTWAYLSGVISSYNENIIAESLPVVQATMVPRISVTGRYWYNEMLNYKYYMLPGILVILVTAIGFMLAGLNLVREKEIGTIEQINVTPVKKSEFIISKMVPFFIIGLADLGFGLILGKIFFNIPFEGSLLLMFLGSAIFLVAVLGLGLFISTFSSTQQQFMFVAFFFIIVFVLMSGIFTPFESMPIWAQKFDLINPVAHLIRFNRMVMLKGSGIADVARELLLLCGIAVMFTTFAVRRYRKTA